MSRSRSQASSSVSLFPFLAVLVCAMGALILLLIVTTRRIRREAIARVALAAEQSSGPAPSPPESVPSVAPALPPLAAIVPSPRETDAIMRAFAIRLKDEERARKTRLARLQRAHRAAKSRTETLQRRLQSAQLRLDQSRRKLKNLQAARQRRKDDKSRDEREASHLQTRIRELAGTISRLRRDLAELKLRQAEASSRFQIIPFDGNTGTTRRPIFVECTENALRILPENISISPTDLQGFTTGHNPLLSGVRALVHYWDAKARASTQREPEPYVLLLVRPSGSVAYYAARKMLRALDRPIGYELIEEDWKLDLPPVDSKAQALCRLAVDRRLAEHEGIAAALRAARRSGLRTPAPGQSAGRLMRFNRATGQFEVIEPDGPQIAHGTGSSKRRPLNSGFGKLLKQDERQPFDGRTTSPPSPEPTSGALSNRRRSASFESAPPQRFESGRGRKTEVGGRKTAASTTRQSPLASGRSPQSSSRSFRLRNADASGGKTDDPEGRRTEVGDRRTEVRDRRTEASTTRQSPLTTHQSPPTNHYPPLTTDQSPLRPLTSGGGGGDGRLWPLKTGNGNGDEKLARRGTKDGQGESGSETGAGVPHGTEDVGPRSGEPGTISARDLKGKPPEEGTGASGSPIDPTPLPKSLAHFARGSVSGGRRRSVRGRQRWGLSDPSAVIGFEREIRIWSGDDRLVIGDRATLRIKKGETREELFRRVVSAIESEARSWGKPPRSFYWVPTLRFEVSPGGNRHYDRLKDGLHRAGLSTVAEYTLDPRPPRTNTGGRHVP